MHASNIYTETEDTTAEMQMARHTCRRSKTVNGYRAISLPKDTTVFNRALLMDFMTVESNNILHIICKDTILSASCFTQGQTSQKIWNDYVRIWSDEIIQADFGPQFRSKNWEALLTICDIKKHTSGVKSHNALGGGERYHEYLHQVYRKVRAEHKDLPKEFVLSAAVKAMNRTAGGTDSAHAL